MSQDSEPDNVSESSGHQGGRPPTDEESAAADEQFAKESDEERANVAKHEKEMMELGAEVKGEGAID